MNDNQQHDPRDRAERARAARLEPPVRQVLPDRRAADAARSRTARCKPLPQPQADPAADTPQAHAQPRDVVLARNAARADRDAAACRARSTSRARGSTIWCCVTPARDHRQGFAAGPPAVAGRRTRQPISRSSAGPARASPRPTPTRVWTASAPVLTPGQAGHAELDQPDRPALRTDHLSVDDGYLFTVKPARRERRATARSRCAPTASPAAPPNRPIRRRWTMHVGPIGCLRRQGRTTTSTGTRSTRTRPACTRRQPRRLARLHRQILADRTRSRPATRRSTASFRKSATRRLPGRLLPMRRSIVAPGQAVTSETRLFAGAKEKSSLDRYENAGITKLSKSIDWGWFEWFMRPIFDLLNWLFSVHRQFRRGDHLPDLHRPPADVPDRRQAVPVDGRRCARSSRR